MIPPFDPDTGNLPLGIHNATWGEVVARYGYTEHRRRLLAGLRAALASLRVAGCARVYLEGSFVTEKRRPADFDGCWDADGVRMAVLDPILLRFEDRRAAQKMKYGGELFPFHPSRSALSESFLESFQRDKFSHDPKGIIAVDLDTLP